ncbi:MAG: polyribonucleotide nucleotidyltransferase, partial [Salinivirgaceae bacterium]|nr:polyribonucleotide nucleotidyltransferase [Salinivirgaceae bacterium]
MNIIKKHIFLPDGREITIETGKLAKQANGSVVVKLGKTMLLATVVAAKDAREDVDFMPLSVEYREKYAAAGRFPGGFLRREGRPGDTEILVSRLIDRVLRPLFPSDFHAETFVTVELISAEKENLPEALAGLAASAALSVSDVPFNGPISECRVARIDGKFVINPLASDLVRADIDLMVGATFENIMMVEGEMDEVDESDMLQALKIAHEEIKKHCQVQLEMAKEVGVVKYEYCHETNDEELRKKVWDECYDKVYAVAAKKNANKKQRGESFAAVKEDFLSQYTEEQEVNKTLVG